MSSARLPGKMMQNIGDKKVIDLVVEKIIRAGVKKENILLLISVEESDDVLAEWAERERLPFFRGPLEDVLRRFSSALELWPCEWVIRVTGDSPFCPSELIQLLVSMLDNASVDFITTAYRRTLPIGANLEAMRSELVKDGARNQAIKAVDRENVTGYWHKNIPAKGLLSIELDKADLSSSSIAIDFPGDLIRARSGAHNAVLESIPWTQLRTKLILPA